MSIEGPTPPQGNLDEQIIADLRWMHQQLTAGNSMRTSEPTKWSMRLTLEEVETILRLADEVIELRRQTVGDWEMDTPLPLRATSVSFAPIGTPAPPSGSFLMTDCPRFGTIHDCPLGGCPTGREARETPPDLVETEGELATRVSERLAPKRRKCRALPIHGGTYAQRESFPCMLPAGHKERKHRHETDEVLLVWDDTMTDFSRKLALAEAPKPIVGGAYPCCVHCSDPMRTTNESIGKPHHHMIPCTACGQPA